MMNTKENPQIKWSKEALQGLARAYMESRVFLTGVELDLFTLLAAVPLTAKQITDRIHADLRALTIVLDALAAMGLLIKKQEVYQTEPSAAKLLSADSAESILSMIQHSADLWDRWSQLTRKIAEPQAADPSKRAFIQTMHLVATPLAPRIVSIVNPGTARRLLDVGGALGTYTMAFLKTSPHMRATLFDLPPVIEMARETIKTAGMLDRVTLVAGDYNKDPLPSAGYDLAFVSAIIHQNSFAENLALFQKIYHVLEPGGRVVIRDHVLSPDRTQPKSGALFAVNMLAGTQGGNCYTEAEIRDFLAQAGFVKMRLVQTDTRMDGLMEAYKPK
jgi:predicted O-methyltransferase YrrM